MTDQPLTPGTLLRIPLGDGTAAMAQVIGAEGEAVAVSVGDVIWDCDPGALDWQTCGLAMLHIALRPASLGDAVAVGEAPVPAEAAEAHAAWRAAPRVVAAPLAVIVRALLAD